MSAIAKVNYSHDAMIDILIAEPAINQGELARRFGYTEGWVSQIIASDAFQARLAGRKEKLVDPLILRSIENRMDGLIGQSMDVIQRKLDTGDVAVALKTFEVASKARGYGARDRSAAPQNNFVVMMPGVAKSSEDWMSAHGVTIEQEKKSA